MVLSKSINMKLKYKYIANTFTISYNTCMYKTYEERKREGISRKIKERRQDREERDSE